MNVCHALYLQVPALVIILPCIFPLGFCLWLCRGDVIPNFVSVCHLFRPCLQYNQNSVSRIPSVFLCMAMCHLNTNQKLFNGWNTLKTKKNQRWSVHNSYTKLNVWIAHSIRNWGHLCRITSYKVIYVRISNLKFWTNAHDGLFDKCSKINLVGSYTLPTKIELSLLLSFSFAHSLSFIVWIVWIMRMG